MDNPNEQGPQLPDIDPASEKPVQITGPAHRGLTSWVKDTWAGPKRMYLIIGGIAVLVVGYGAFVALTAVHHVAPAPVDNGPAIPQHTGIAGGKAPAPYKAAVAAFNTEGAQKAEQKGGSFMPTLNTMQKVVSAPAPAPAPTKTVVVQAAQVLQPVGFGAYGDQNRMNKEIRGILKASKPMAALTADTTGKIAGQSSVTTAAAANAVQHAKPQPVILAQPGHISFATLDTSIKSTEPGPVMATIATGRFAGARLLGGFVRHAGRVVVEFNQMTLHHQTYPIQAVAITTATARTALSTYTNYHTMYRYGWLVGAALLEGVNNALQMANTSTYLTGSGIGVVSQQLSNGQIAASAVGNVGTVMAPIMMKRFNTPPTVHVKAGTGVGILFMKPVEQTVTTGKL
ncbi:DotG/IcmE/VirB10 family protein [Acidithiobacillus sp. MC6.1]|nr:DotG/IcmE/VirB10 family protein [Acidithiobacillus sp. MC6.1]